MNDNIKVGIGFFIPASAIIFFIASIYAENFLLSAFISILGLLSWFLYSVIMQTSMPNATGNIIILFGVLLSLSIFLSFGIKRNMFGGYELVAEGGAGSAILLLIIVLVGILFKKNSATPSLSVQSEHKIPLNTLSAENQSQAENKKNTSINYTYEDDDNNDYDWDEEEYEDYWDEEEYEE